MTRPLTIAVGGNALLPPTGDLSWGAQRARVTASATELVRLVAGDQRLLIVHGNGPQVGRLLAAPDVGDVDALDIHVAQTQGELGYLLAAALDAAFREGHAALRGRDEAGSVAVITRAIVDPADPAFAAPSKPVGAVRASPPVGVASVSTPDGRGYRRVVASPRPLAIPEEAAVRALLTTHHVIAGGGGGVPLSARDGTPVAAVVDKDWIAARLAIACDAARLVFVTDVAGAHDRYGHPDAAPIARMGVREARERLAAGVFAPGSMAPKVESAVQFVEATGRPALITALGAVAAGLAGHAGTTVSDA